MKLTGIAPLTSGRCALTALRIALISGVAWSCLAGLASSAEAATVPARIKQQQMIDLRMLPLSVMGHA